MFGHCLWTPVSNPQTQSLEGQGSLGCLEKVAQNLDPGWVAAGKSEGFVDLEIVIGLAVRPYIAFKVWPLSLLNCFPDDAFEFVKKK